MAGTTVAISCTLANGDANDINLMVHRLYTEQSSPCIVIENGDRRGIGGHIESVEEILESELAKHPGYTVKDRTNVVMTLAVTELNDIKYSRWSKKLESWTRARRVSDEPCWLCDEIDECTTYQSRDLSKSQDWSYDICGCCEQRMGFVWSHRG